MPRKSPCHHLIIKMCIVSKDLGKFDENLLHTFQKPVKSSFVSYEAVLLILSPGINTNYNLAL